MAQQPRRESSSTTWANGMSLHAVK
jgi:hypothetical protein